MIGKHCPLGARKRFCVVMDGECYNDSLRKSCVKECSFFRKRILKAKWTQELQADLKMYHSLNIEDELMAIIGEEIEQGLWNDKHEMSFK